MNKEQTKCCTCGKFISLENAIVTNFIPDTPFTSEQIEITCKKCLNNVTTK